MKKIRLSYSVTSKMVGLGVLAMVPWILTIPAFPSPWFYAMMALAGLGLVSVIVGVCFQNLEERDERLRG